MGAGIVIDGKLYSGANTGAGEIGCIPYLDRDYEYYCSSRFFVGRGTSGKEACERAAAGDPEALALWNEFGGHVGRLVMLTLYAYDPEAIVFGGSISHGLRLLSGRDARKPPGVPLRPDRRTAAHLPFGDRTRRTAGRFGLRMTGRR